MDVSRDAGPESTPGAKDAAPAPLGDDVGRAPADPRSSDPEDEVIFPPFSLSFRFDDDLRTSLRSLSLSDNLRLNRTVEPLPPVGAAEPAKHNQTQ